MQLCKELFPNLRVSDGALPGHESQMHEIPMHEIPMHEIPMYESRRQKRFANVSQWIYGMHILGPENRKGG